MDFLTTRQQTDDIAALMRRGWLATGRAGLLAVVLWGLLAATLAPSAVAQPQQPDIIVIMTDDQGCDAFGGLEPTYRNELQVHTPNLASMARGGVIFSNCRVQPVCSPTRAGFLTGRDALKTGVVEVVRGRDPFRTQVALQTWERTIAEVLKDRGYYNVLLDKWHVNGSPEDQKPEAQGFDRVIPMYINLDDSIEVGDEHITLMSNLAIKASRLRPDPDQPMAMFVWTIDPHDRDDDTGRDTKGWWRVDERLLPSGTAYYHPTDPTRDTRRNRYRAVVESIDTEIARMLRELGVIDADNRYLPESNTIVFFLGDNGTPQGVAPDPLKAKDSLYEGGIRVPFFVFGANVPSDGRVEERLVSYVDFYDTIADIVGADDQTRGINPRDSVSFADAIGWSPDPLPQREYTLSSLSNPDPLEHRVALTDGRFKLIAKAGTQGLAKIAVDDFFDLELDPNEETDLIGTNMLPEQRIAYRRMRDDIVNHWFTAVQEPTVDHADIPLTHIMSLSSDDVQQTEALVIGHRTSGGASSWESRIFVRFDIDNLETYFPAGKTFDDVERAQIILFFNRDSQASDQTDTGRLSAHACTTGWHSRPRNWNQLEDEWNRTVLGLIDPAPNIVTTPGDPKQGGLPMVPGCPISLGQDVDLIDLVDRWVDQRPANNYGVTIRARPMPELDGDQTLNFLNNAVLRLTFRIE